MERPAFALGSGGCRCASCSHISEFNNAGFAKWPRGNPAGHRSSAAAYSAHVAHSRRDARKGDNGQGFKLPGLVYPVAPAPKLVLDWIAASYAWAPKAPVTRIRQVPRLVQLARDLRKAA